jgi:uncharacterized membrane protein YbhN (UPF0104 family)
VKRWLFTAISFAAVIAVSVYAVRSGAADGESLALPWYAHALALLAFTIEVVSRAYKLVWGAKAVRAKLHVQTAARVCLGGDFGAAITPSRSGAEPARYLMLAEAGVGVSDAMVIMYTELFFEVLSLAVVVAAMVLIFDVSTNARVALGGIIGVYAATVGGIGAVGYVLSRRTLGDVPPPWATRLWLTGGRWTFVRRWVDRVRTTVDSFRGMHLGWGAASLGASVVHVAVRFTILPVIVISMVGASAALAPLVVWPFGFIYGAALVPAPAGGGAVEFAFHAALDNTIPNNAFAASLLWWRFYSFYLYIALGVLVAGNTVLRAVRDAQDTEEELERNG